jgi:hypothetical protein
MAAAGREGSRGQMFCKLGCEPSGVACKGQGPDWVAGGVGKLVRLPEER